MKKKILIVNGPLVGGGAEKVLIDVLKHFDYSKYEVDLALINKSGVHLDKVPSQVRIIELWPEKSTHHFIGVKFSTKLHSNMLLASRMNSGRLRNDYDAEIAFLEGWPTKLLSLRNSKARKIAWVHVDLEQFNNSLSCYHHREEERRAYCKMDAIVNVSEQCRDSISRMIPEIADRAVVINNLVEKEVIQTLAAKEQNPYTGFLPDSCLKVVIVGRVHRQKNPMRLLDTVLLAKKEGLNVRFVWVGDGEMMPEVKKRVDELDIEEYVKFIGFKNNPYPYIKHSDVMMLPSDAEGFSIATCETMCLGIPIISTNTAGQSDLLGENECGLLTGFTPEELFAALKRMVSDPDLRKSFSEKALQRVEALSPDRMLQKVYEIIENRVE